MKLQEKIREQRKQNSMSQEQLAQMLNISRQSISKWESGDSTPDVQKIISLSEIFGVSTDYLLKDTGSEDCLEQQVRINNNTPSQNTVNTNRKFAILGSINMSIGLVGLFILKLLSTVNPIQPGYIEEVGSGIIIETATGFFAFLERYNIKWLFNMCWIFIVIGIIFLLIYFVKRSKKSDEVL